MTADKIRENRLRRAAERQGLRLVKSRRRDPRALDFGGFMIVADPNGEIVAGALPRAFSLTLDEIEEWLLTESWNPQPQAPS